MNAALKPLPYYPISNYFKEKFGEKIYKVSVSIAESCPNRLGRGGMETCVFCDVWGSAAYHTNRDLELTEQIRINRDKIRKRYKAKKFLVYFQSYTNTFLQAKELERRIQTALKEDDIVGIVVGTRPDCLPRKMLEIFKEVNESSYLLIELGAQSFNEQALKFMKRGHTAKKTKEAILKIADSVGSDIGIHLIFGSPGETLDDVVNAAKILNDLPVNNVKLHNLHILKNTSLEQLYLNDQFKPIELEEYSEKVGLFLSYLSPNIAVQRLAASANRWDELIAPDWTKERLKTHQYIIDHMLKKGIKQGILNFV